MPVSYGAVLNLLAILGFGVFVPWRKGLEFLDPAILFPYFGLSLVFVAPLVTSAVPEPRTQRAIGTKISAALALGWGTALFIVVLGLLTVNLLHWHGHALLPSIAVLRDAALLSLLGSLFVAAGGTWLALIVGPGRARSVLRLFFLALLLAFALPSTRLWDDFTDAGLHQLTAQASLAFAVLDSLALWAALRKAV
jgi:hypothetical protein